jgi:2-oxo-4-hydroxy-4-carboxy--5-ureidoimidazoline (OHCU) decarboxylase
MKERVRHSPELELAAALAEVAKIARFRLDGRISSPTLAG